MVIARRSISPSICAAFLCGQSTNLSRCLENGRSSRAFSETAVLPQQHAQASAKHGTHIESSEQTNGQEEEPGGMSKRLSQMTKESIEHDSRRVQELIAEGGFSGELKRQLEARIMDSSFKSENPAAFAQLNMPSSAGKGTRDIAAAYPWAGDEKMEDGALRMLNDAHKPLRGTGPPRIPTPRALPSSVDVRMKRTLQKSHGERLANARDRTSAYALSRDPTLSDKEREQMRRNLKERFTAGARPMPGSVQGLAALANERIEDAISRGQFQNITRGKGKNVERDYNANSPFLDTTEYFLNKIIQKQEIVPPWIEKQQKLVKAATVFRARIRTDWKRHAARVIASKGGSLDAQVQRAKAYAAAEAANNPRAKKTESMTEFDNEGRLSQLIVTEASTPATDASDTNITISEDLSSIAPSRAKAQDTSEATKTQHSPGAERIQAPSPSLLQVRLFRDPAWESLEFAYHSLAIKELNNLTRTYNLEAPDLAKKPYFSLERELRSCFADIAPQLPNEIRERAHRPERARVEVVGHRVGSMLEKLSTDKVKVYDSTKPNYGFKQFWKDLWGIHDSKA